MTPLAIPNRVARQLLLQSLGLETAPVGRLDVLSIIKQLGFVQLDTIRVIARAHDHIIWSRNQNYREPMLNKVLAKDRAVFEHFTHDASVLPIEFYPMWQRQFRRLKTRADRSNFYKNMLDETGRTALKDRIAEEGPLSTLSFDTKVSGDKHMWARPPHKLALDYMWYSGELATAHRKNFTKFYDLPENVIPEDFRAADHEDEMQIDWLCRNALDRLVFATPGEVQRFWDAVGAEEVRAWIDRTEATLVPVVIEAADRSWSKAIAPSDILDRIANLCPPTSRLRILNPFDPLIRDRARLKRLFGFDYRIEIFVPEAKRQWGYYVFPLLEGDRFVGRIEAKADRKSGILSVINIWPEGRTKWTERRHVKLEAELARLARFTGLQEVCWTCSAP